MDIIFYSKKPKKPEEVIHITEDVISICIVDQNGETVKAEEQDCSFYIPQRDEYVKISRIINGVEHKCMARFKYMIRDVRMCFDSYIGVHNMYNETAKLVYALVIIPKNEISSITKISPHELETIRSVYPVF